MDNFEILTTDIKNRNTIIQIKCLNCGQIFKKTYWNFIRSKYCPLCNPNKARKRKTTEQFIKEARLVHKNNFDYSLVDYKNNKTKIKIKCLKCGQIFEQIPKSHLEGCGCPFCDGGIKDTKEIFIEKAKKIYGEDYDYSLVDYKNTWEKVKIKCNKCGKIFEISPNSFLQGRCCICKEKSFGEKIIKDFLIENNINFQREFIFKDLKNKGYLRFDFYLPELNTAIEFQGEQHYVPREYWGGQKYLEILKENDNLKREYCLKNSIKEIEIPYTELRNIYNILQEKLLD